MNIYSFQWENLICDPDAGTRSDVDLFTQVFGGNSFLRETGCEGGERALYFTNAKRTGSPG